MGSYWKARHAGTYEVYAKYMKKIYELSPPIYNYILSKGEEQFLYSHPNHPHYSQETNNPCESFNAGLRRGNGAIKSVRECNIYNMIMQFIVASIDMSIDRLEILQLYQKPNLLSDEIPPPNPTWCQYIFLALAQTGHHAVMKEEKVYKLLMEECYDYMADDGKWYPIHVVEDRSWDKEHFHVDLCRHRCS